MSILVGLSNLPMPPEPVETKRGFAAEMERNPWLAKTNLREGGWLTRELWSLWGPWLEREGLTPERVQEGVGECSPYFLQWIQDELAWEQAVSKVVNSVASQS